ncbi:hypothetical protein SAMN02745885_00326 [Carboxydocella sporoproducens DSM 16521]|uniref:Uncharacterized protein n=2 Tax=Carboxydocella TaxID=178898 RepID=A0A1T4LVF7_9FIRM|nr:MULTISPECIES: hypothetical protein [Carboxydocella]AVX20634.1 hypothetical protein CFE_1445 [Carboxydocella thermautotrophica]SJZ58713.1 hypothetical protein SAMN02745885_00326 [Carboxydocella sporoproducens DSM 16521]
MQQNNHSYDLNDLTFCFTFILIAFSAFFPILLFYFVVNKFQAITITNISTETIFLISYLIFVFTLSILHLEGIKLNRKVFNWKNALYFSSLYFYTFLLIKAVIVCTTKIIML